jgi:hypothetical protein
MVIVMLLSSAKDATMVSAVLQYVVHLLEIFEAQT